MDSTTSAISPVSNAQAGNASAANVAKASSSPSAASVAKAAAAADAAAAAKHQDTTLQRDPRSLQFQVDGNRVITTIVDENNKTVVVQIPDADMIRIAKAIDRMQGFLVKDKA